MRGVALTSSRDFHIFATTTTQVLNWISGQEKVLKQNFELKDIQAIEVNTQMVLQMTKTLDEKISQVIFSLHFSNYVLGKFFSMEWLIAFDNVFRIFHDQKSPPNYQLTDTIFYQ